MRNSSLSSLPVDGVFHIGVVCCLTKDFSPHRKRYTHVAYLCLLRLYRDAEAQLDGYFLV